MNSADRSDRCDHEERSSFQLPAAWITALLVGGGCATNRGDKCTVSIFPLQATEEQMWAAGKLMRDVCLPKFPKVSVATADEIHNGNLPDDKDSKCYMNCIMEMMQTVSRNFMTVWPYWFCQSQY